MNPGMDLYSNGAVLSAAEADMGVSMFKTIVTGLLLSSLYTVICSVPSAIARDEKGGTVIGQPNPAPDREDIRKGGTVAGQPNPAPDGEGYWTPDRLKRAKPRDLPSVDDITGPTSNATNTPPSTAAPGSPGNQTTPPGDRNIIIPERD
jgi:hypothetical protein